MEGKPVDSRQRLAYTSNRRCSWEIVLGSGVAAGQFLKRFSGWLQSASLTIRMERFAASPCSVVGLATAAGCNVTQSDCDYEHFRQQSQCL
jgi:hypothetical protein